MPLLRNSILLVNMCKINWPFIKRNTGCCTCLLWLMFALSVCICVSADFCWLDAPSQPADWVFCVSAPLPLSFSHCMRVCVCVLPGYKNHTVTRVLPCRGAQVRNRRNRTALVFPWLWVTHTVSYIFRQSWVCCLQWSMMVICIYCIFYAYDFEFARSDDSAVCIWRLGEQWNGERICNKRGFHTYKALD